MLEQHIMNIEAQGDAESFFVGVDPTKGSICAHLITAKTQSALLGFVARISK